MSALAPGLLGGVTPDRALLLLLVAGHLLGDFLFPLPWMAGKRRKGYGTLTAHVAAVTAVHIAVLLPFFGFAVFAVMGAVGLGHAAVDLFEELKERRFAEYYLVGTLTSLLVAFATGVVLSLVLFGGVR